MENLKKEKKKRFTIYKLFKKSRKLIEEVQLVNRATFFFFSNHICICKLSKLEYIVYSKKYICGLIDGAISWHKQCHIL